MLLLNYVSIVKNALHHLNNFDFVQNFDPWFIAKLRIQAFEIYVLAIELEFEQISINSILDRSNIIIQQFDVILTLAYESLFKYASYLSDCKLKSIDPLQIWADNVLESPTAIANIVLNSDRPPVVAVYNTDGLCLEYVVHDPLNLDQLNLFEVPSTLNRIVSDHYIWAHELPLTTRQRNIDLDFIHYMITKIRRELFWIHKKLCEDLNQLLVKFSTNPRIICLQTYIRNKLITQNRNHYNQVIAPWIHELLLLQ